MVGRASIFLRTWHGHPARVAWAGRPCRERACTGILLLWIAAGCLPAPAQYVPPRPPRVARTLQPHHVMRIVTNAPEGAKIQLPKVNVRKWQAWMDVQPGDLIEKDGSVFCCVQRHTTQPGWLPEAIPALWRVVRTPSDGAVPDWRQPLGTHDAYRMGDRVMFNGLCWETTIDYNVWMPGEYGWKEVKTKVDEAIRERVK